MSKLLAGRYELIEKIGEGGMAVVYKAKCRLLNRYVAIKILRPEFTKDAQFVENFKRESQAAAGLQHQNIVSVYDVGKEGNIHFIVMELIDGRPLSDLIHDHGTFDYKEAIEITKQVASALSLAHRNHIIHRDVKPHNIMITKDGIAKLADFGIAKAVSDSTMVSQETSRIIGSVHYFSPEQARGAYVDERSDIYSLGIVLYEMLTGQVPFDGDNPVQVALMHINDDIQPPSQLVSGIPPALEKLVMKATDKYQSNRYKNAEEVLEELTNIEFVTKMVGDSVFLGAEHHGHHGHHEQDGKQRTDDREAADDQKTQKQREKKEPAKNKKKLMIGVAAGVIALIAVIAGVLLGSGAMGGVEVPNVVGMTPDQAKVVLEEAGLVVEEGEPVRSSDVNKGEVAVQTPEFGEKVDKGSVVTIMISEGKPTGVVPKIVGQMYDETIAPYLEAQGYKLGTVKEEESDAEKGEIIRQDPGAGAEAEQGTTINIVVSKGTDKVRIPSLLGLTLDEAKETLKEHGFVIGSVTYEESTVYAKNIVMGQEYAEDDKVKKGTKVGVVVSKGEPEAVPEPEVPVVAPEEEEDSQEQEEESSDEGEVENEETSEDEATEE
ncbi:MAG: Stk1 family PASTA domain-containing Ser/Thr kinase [Firmicutes bacterium]|nr:Stk1 family PASTA domain-containing Ser/Thr kinase [Bacillota bacterium]